MRNWKNSFGSASIIDYNVVGWLALMFIVMARWLSLRIYCFYDVRDY